MSSGGLYSYVSEALAPFEGQRVGVAVSGGGDSMALLDVMLQWRARTGSSVLAVTVDHGLRAEAAEEAALVARYCAAKGVAHETLTWDDWDGQGNLQGAARAARYRLMANWARETGLAAVCVAHTADDQAETVLMRLARKAGSDGLGSMAERFKRAGMLWLRPLLGVARAELRVHLRAGGIDWVEDPSNRDARFERVKARQALEYLAPLGIGVEELSAVAAHLRGEAAYMQARLYEELRPCLREDLGALSLGEAEFAALHPEMRRRFLGAALCWIAQEDYAPRAEAVARFGLGLLKGEAQTLHGVIGWAARGRVWLAREYRALGGGFDARWAQAEGGAWRALGDEGLAQRPAWRELGLPRRVLLPLPGRWRGETLEYAPHIDKSVDAAPVFLPQSFLHGLKPH